MVLRTVFTLQDLYMPEKFYRSALSPSALCALVSFEHESFRKQQWLVCAGPGQHSHSP